MIELIQGLSAVPVMDLLPAASAMPFAELGTDAASAAVTSANPAGAWDFGSFLKNATKTAKTWGSAAIILVGVVLLIWGAIMAGKRFMGGQQQQGPGWGKIAAMVIVGGAFMAGGFSLISTIGSGGKKTLLDLGGGSILPNMDAVSSWMAVLPF